MKALYLSFKTLLTLIAFTWLTGCVQQSTVPGYARAGDTLILGLGGVARNSLDNTLKTSDLTVVLTDSAGTDHPLQASAVFKFYAAHDNALNQNVIADGNISVMNLEVFDGGWFVSVPLTVDGTSNTTPLLAMAPGQATISVTSPLLINTQSAGEGSQQAMTVELLADPTNPAVVDSAPYDSDYNQQFAMYKQSAYTFDISPDDLTGISSAAGAYFQIDYNDSLFAAGKPPVIVPSSHNPYVQLSYNTIDNGDGTGTIYVTLLNPAGFTDTGPTTSNVKVSRLADLSIRMQYFPESAETARSLIEGQVSVDLASSYYIDTAGSEITGLEPDLVHVLDL